MIADALGKVLGTDDASPLAVVLLLFAFAAYVSRRR